MVTLPDFEMLFTLADDIGRLTKEVGLLKVELEFEESRIVKTVSTDMGYFVEDAKGNKKPPAMNFVEAAYFPSGLNDELLAKRQELATKEGELKHKEMTLQLMKIQVDVYRTESANARGTG
jgi:hypothetical protein